MWFVAHLGLSQKKKKGMWFVDLRRLQEPRHILSPHYSLSSPFAIDDNFESLCSVVLSLANPLESRSRLGCHSRRVLQFQLQHLRENHLEERLLDQAQARASYTPLFWGHSRSIPQGMILDVQPLVKSLFCPIRASPNGFFDFEASTP